jgi:hypothetical protein
MTVILTIVLGIAGSLLAAEFFGSCPWLTEALLSRAAHRLPKVHRERYVAEWDAELDYMRSRCGNLTILFWAVSVYLSSRRLASEVRDLRLATSRRKTYQLPLFRFTEPGTGMDVIDIPTVIRQLSDDEEEHVVQPDKELGPTQANPRERRRDGKTAEPRSPILPVAEPFVLMVPRGSDSDGMRRFFSEIESVHGKLGKRTNITLGQLTALVRRQTDFVRERYHVDAVSFRVDVIDGRVKLRAKPIRE